MKMCQSDCGTVDKENWDWNNNASTFSAHSHCQCMLARRTRRRHPATIQTPGRLEVGEVFLEPLVSNRLDENQGGVRMREEDKNLNFNYNCSKENGGGGYLNHSLQSFQNKQQRFDVLGDQSYVGGGGWNQNFMSSSKLT